MNIVRLTANEWSAAGAQGAKRRAEHDVNRRHEAVCSAEDDRLGAVCEYAVAKALGPDVLADWVATKAYVPNGGHYTLPDVGRSVFVRGAPLGRKLLIVHEHPERKPMPAPAGFKRKFDVADAPFVLALHDASRFVVNIIGWQMAEYVRAFGEWSTWGPFGVNPAFTLPRDKLLPFSTLPPEYVR